MASPSQNPGPRGRGSGFLGVEADAEEVLGLEPQVPTPLVLVGAPDGPLAETNEDPPEGLGRERHGLLLDHGEKRALGVSAIEQVEHGRHAKRVNPTPRPV